MDVITDIQKMVFLNTPKKVYNRIENSFNDEMIQ